jgi:hypothetical protein
MQYQQPYLPGVRLPFAYGQQTIALAITLKLCGTSAVILLVYFLNEVIIK